MTDDEVAETLDLLAGIEVLEYDLQFNSHGLWAILAYSTKYAGCLELYRKGYDRALLKIAVAAYGAIRWYAGAGAGFIGKPSDFYVKVRRI